MIFLKNSHYHLTKIAFFLFLITTSTCGEKNQSKLLRNEPTENKLKVDLQSEKYELPFVSFPMEFSYSNDFVGFDVLIKNTIIVHDKIITANRMRSTRYYKYYPLDYESQILVFKNDSLICDYTVKKQDFIQFNNLKFWNRAILKAIYPNYIESTKEYVTIDIFFGIPDNRNNYLYKLLIDKYGIVTVTH